ncbi:LysR family transcriptional regulator [Paraburkholderia dipogonis]|uniref:LysR family transcriptional regulator n=1 Tax=Paraburkholderia dipogonis TaxID=1211383 RepID=A0A4Y8MIW4_9BURK|nr:LysR family transcriptional regulator [Paraburkholderia dipogonis]
MNTRFLETFVTLAQLENFRATARLLNTTPATVSLRIRSLEDEFKTELIDRSSAKFRLTPAGQNLVGLAKNVVNATRILQESASHAVVARDRMRIGVIDTVVHSWLSAYMRRVSADFPNLQIDLTVDSSAVLKRRMLSGELDVVVRVEGIDSPRIESRTIASYPLRWIARHDLLSGKQGALIQEVLAHPVLTFGRGTTPQLALENLVHRLAEESGVPVEMPRMTCLSSVAAILQLVREGYGVAAIPAIFVCDALSSGEFVEVPLGHLLPPIVVSLCTRVDASPMVRAAAETAASECVAYALHHSRALIETF